MKGIMNPHRFQYNVPDTNHITGYPDLFIDVVAYKLYDGSVSVNFPMLHASHVIAVKDWLALVNDCTRLAAIEFEMMEAVVSTNHILQLKNGIS